MQYALIVFVTDYATSFLNVIHFMTVSMQNDMRWYVTLPEVFVFLALNPIAPAVNCLLWMIFRILEKQRMIRHYRFLSKLTCLINGTFESPVQIILTLFFFITGRILPPWLDTTEFMDSLGNKISLGAYISVVSFTLCWISLFKNVADSYQCEGLRDLLTVIAFVLPNVLFRIFSYTTLFIFIREWIIVPISLIFVINLFIGGQMIPDQRGINLSSTSFCSIFCAVGMPNDPSAKSDPNRRDEMDPKTQKNLTLLITIVGLPIIVGVCWLTYQVLPAYTGMKQDSINIQLTDDQEFFLMAYSYSGLIGLSILSSLFFWIFFNNRKVPEWTKVCVNILTILATFYGIVLTIIYFPPSPLSVVLTVEKENSGVEIFEGLIYNSTNISNNNCQVENTEERGTMLKCGNTSMIAEFASKRKSLSMKDHKLIVLDPNTDESTIFHAFNQRNLNIFHIHSEMLQIHLKNASCLKCHHEDSNVCRNIIAASEKKHCSSTCSSVAKTLVPISTEDLDILLEMDFRNRTADKRWFWKETTVHYGTVSQAKVLCKAPNHFFESEPTAECQSGEGSECRITQLKCVGNDKWKMDVRPRCRPCKTDSECIRVRRGNKCTEGVCMKEMLLIGLSQERVSSHQNMVLLEPASLKTETCKIPALPLHKVKTISQIGNALYSFGEDGDPFRLDGRKWTSMKSMKIPRTDAAAINLKDGRRLISGGKSTTSFKALDSTEFLLANMGR